MDDTLLPVGWCPVGSMPFYVSCGRLRSPSFGLCSAAKSLPPAAFRSRLTVMHCLWSVAGFSLHDPALFHGVAECFVA